MEGLRKTTKNVIQWESSWIRDL